MITENDIYPGYAEDVRKREERLAVQDAAHAAVLPGALRAAFNGDPAAVNVNGASFTLQPVTLGLAANLERVKSPLLEVVRIMREVFSNEEGRVKNEESSQGDSKTEPFKEVQRRVAALNFEEEQIAETVFIFTRPQKRVRQLLDKGAQAFREAAMEELGDKLHPTQMAALQRECAQHYVRSFATIIGYGAPPAEDGSMVFPAPSASAATGSAGGSTSSAH